MGEVNPSNSRGSSQRKLRNLLINPRYQVKYIFWTTFTGLFLIFINSMVFYVFIRENYKILVDMSPMEDEAKALLYRELHQIVFLLGGFSTVFLVAVSLFGLVLSHRTAGPMYHFKRVFREIRAGKHDLRIRLRPKDDFADVARDCNEMIDYLMRK
ncbi:methyl-accepting chemotaxis protein [Bdellovibrionota bacterium FG-2]